MKRLFVATACMLVAGLASAAVNVNSAQQSELQRTKGLDKYKAKAIIEYRAQHGPFASIDDLEKVNGFNREVIAKVGPQLAVSGPPYTPPKAEPKEKEKEKAKK